MSAVPTIILGGTGYVAGELLRLVAGHPQLTLQAVLSDSQPGESVAKSFPHLAPALPELKFSSLDDVKKLVTTLPVCAILAAAPHGVSAALLDGLMTTAEQAGTTLHIVDISADFRYRSAAAYDAVYKHTHGAPQRLDAFTCAVPEHLAQLTTKHVAHPGCFATATLLASVPLLQLGLVEPQIFVAGITGSTGSGRTPAAGTHHPQRHSDLYAYNALEHRHTPEIAACAAAASGVQADFRFVPHSGPFARGIHVTVQAKAIKPVKTADLLAMFREFYQNAPFVMIGTELPHVKDVVASNYARIGAVAGGDPKMLSEGDTVAVMCAIDNLVKGAAGGAVQWLNRLLGFNETAGLTAPAPGWT